MFICFAMPMFLDLLRALFGPFSKPACLTGIFLKNVTSFNVSLIMVFLTSTKLIFIFAFKRIPIMDDQFWAHYIYTTTSLISVLASSFRLYQPGRPVLNEVMLFTFYYYNYYNFFWFCCLVANLQRALLWRLEERKEESQVIWLNFHHLHWLALANESDHKDEENVFG